MKTQATRQTHVMSKPAVRDRALRTPGGLSVRLDVKAIDLQTAKMIAAGTASPKRFGLLDRLASDAEGRDSKAEADEDEASAAPVKNSTAKAVKAPPRSKRDLGVLFALEAVGQSSAAAPFPAHMGWKVQQDRRVRLYIAVHPPLELGNAGPRDAAPAGLIRVGRIGKAIAQDPRPCGQYRQNNFVEMLAAGSKEKERLRLGVQRFCTIQNEFPQPLAQSRPSRLARKGHGDALPPQKIREPGDVGRLARTVDALEGNEFAAHQRRPDLWYLATARSCSTSVREKCEVPSPRDTK